jgi:hypothetical protein
MPENNYQFAPIFGRSALLLAVVSLCALCGEASAQPHVLKWNFEATVYNKADPHTLFPDVRVGDNVRGTLAYNVNANRTWDEFFFGVAYYFLGPTFPVTEFVVENPRTGIDLEFKLDETNDYSGVYLEMFETDSGDEVDLFYTDGRALVPVPVPEALKEDFKYPTLEFWLEGPRGNLTSPKLPTELDLDDWPIATISFYNSFFQFSSHTRIEAEIYSLTPVPFETVPGDFDADGDADARDNTIWRSTFGYTEANEDIMDADADGSGVIDAGDYVVWRHAVSALAQMPVPADASPVSVPEPSTLIMLVSVLAVLRRQRPSHRFINGTNCN